MTVRLTRRNAEASPLISDISGPRSIAAVIDTCGYSRAAGTGRRAAGSRSPIRLHPVWQHGLQRPSTHIADSARSAHQAYQRSSVCLQALRQHQPPLSDRALGPSVRATRSSRFAPSCTAFGLTYRNVQQILSFIGCPLSMTTIRQDVLQACAVEQTMRPFDRLHLTPQEPGN